MKIFKNIIKGIVIFSILLISGFSIVFISVRAPGMTRFDVDFNLIKAMTIGFLSLFSLIFNVRTFNIIVQRNSSDILDVDENNKPQFKKLNLIVWLGNLLFGVSIIFLGIEMLSRFTSFVFNQVKGEDNVLLMYSYYMIIMGFGLIINGVRLYFKVKRETA